MFQIGFSNHFSHIGKKEKKCFPFQVLMTCEKINGHFGGVSLKSRAIFQSGLWLMIFTTIIIWQYRLWSFESRSTISVRFLPMNECVKKIWYRLKWNRVELSKIDFCFFTFNVYVHMECFCKKNYDMLYPQGWSSITGVLITTILDFIDAQHIFVVINFHTSFAQKVSSYWLLFKCNWTFDSFIIVGSRKTSFPMNGSASFCYYFIGQLCPKL